MAPPPHAMPRSQGAHTLLGDGEQVGAALRAGAVALPHCARGARARPVGPS